MKRILLIYLITLTTTITSFSQHSLTVKIVNLRNNEEKVHLYLFDKNQKNITSKTKTIKDKECIIVIENIQIGEYAFKYFHDENNNNKLDCNWMKIPKEGYGFSNNAIGKFGPPDFEDYLFKLKENKKAICHPTY